MEDLLLGPLIGGLKHNQAYLWGRISPEAAARRAAPAVLHAWLGQQPDLSDAYLAGRSLPLAAEAGFAGVAVVAGLAPSQRYYYALTLDESPPKPTVDEFPFFVTAPPPGQAEPFSFAFGSCFRPSGPESGQAFAALDRQRQAASGAQALRFALFIGDQIYADAYQYNGLGRVACSLEDYRAAYAYSWSIPALRRLLCNLPVFMTLDDHEVDDDWRWTDAGRQWADLPLWDKISRWLEGRPPQERNLPAQRVRDALQAYWEHQGMHAPPFELPPQVNPAGQYTLYPQDPGSLAYSYTFGATAFFVLDTRSMRVRGPGQRSMLGEGQWNALLAWLGAVKDAYPVKFIVSSCSLLYRMWADIPQDRWSGYPRERDRLLHHLAANGIQGVYLLAGDLHSAHAVYAELYGPQGRPIPLWEFCSTPFEQKSSLLTRLTFDPRRFGPLKRLERKFIVNHNNYGVVRVGYSPRGRAVVKFEVYGEHGELLAEAG
jgi:alkaline phosphatase D